MSAFFLDLIRGQRRQFGKGFCLKTAAGQPFDRPAAPTLRFLDFFLDFPYRICYDADTEAVPLGRGRDPTGHELCQQCMPFSSWILTILLSDGYRPVLLFHHSTTPHFLSILAEKKHGI